MDDGRHISRGAGTRQTECVRYSSCLEVIAKANWRAWNCDHCPQFAGRVPQPDPFAEEMRTGGEMMSAKPGTYETPTSKACSKCGVDKPLTAYAVAKAGKYGRRAQCRACDAKYFQGYKRTRKAAPGGPRAVVAEKADTATGKRTRQSASLQADARPDAVQIARPRLALALRLTSLLMRIDITMDEADITCAVYEVLEKESL